MSNQTARLARQWAEDSDPAFLNEQTRAARDHILATTPEPTMADVEWDYAKHFLAGATHKETNAPLVMIGPAMGDKTTDCVALSLNCGYQVENRNLTPNGKRYELREVTDEHPETLRTVEDYENAPEGTIVAQDGCDSWVKTNTNIWACGVVTYVNRDMSATGPYRVLRWGWGE